MEEGGKKTEGHRDIEALLHEVHGHAAAHDTDPDEPIFGRPQAAVRVEGRRRRHLGQAVSPSPPRSSSPLALCVGTGFPQGSATGSKQSVHAWSGS